MRLLHLITFLTLQLLAPAQEDRISSIEIPADSKSPYDFRAQPKWDDPAYVALNAAKTYGELHEALITFMNKWSARPDELAKPVEIEAYFTAKQALIRMFYVKGQVEEGDKLMGEFHPKALGLSAKREDNKAIDPVEREKLNRTADRIRAIYSEIGEGDPFPNGAPNNIHELYAPLFKVIKDLAG